MLGRKGMVDSCAIRVLESSTPYRKKLITYAQVCVRPDNSSTSATLKYLYAVIVGYRRFEEHGRC